MKPRKQKSNGSLLLVSIATFQYVDQKIMVLLMKIQVQLVGARAEARKRNMIMITTTIGKRIGQRRESPNEIETARLLVTICDVNVCA